MIRVGKLSELEFIYGRYAGQTSLKPDSLSFLILSVTKLQDHSAVGVLQNFPVAFAD